MSIHKYRVITTYCDDVVTRHDHDAGDLRKATYEYSEVLADAIVTDGKRPEGSDALHIRNVQLHALDNNEETIRAIDSGIFPCEDRA